MANENLNQKLTGEAWADITIKNWQVKINKIGIGTTNDLYESFRRHVFMAANGDINKIELAYEWYGSMVDMGVGRGTKLGDVRENALSRRIEGKSRGNARRPKKWKSSSLFSDQIRLSEILAEKYGIKQALMIKENLDLQLGN
ncbi:MAG: hypothetical protein EOP53_11895 [Sphingobacteriales bacterium]|nr:MAG: hypothetical protein EOP53_11895 [Sphingobacteriales bacterium]